ncbi:hypothetical protein M9458_004536, partial [Cirrhinus mrigala]
FFAWPSRLICLAACLLDSCSFHGLFPRLAPHGLRSPRIDPRLPLGLFLCLAHIYLFAVILTLPVLAMSLSRPMNKSLHLDLLASRFFPHVTEYSVEQGSSNFTHGHYTGMDTTRILLRLKQGPRTLEQHVSEFLAIANHSDLPDYLLIQIFCDGLNEPLKAKLRREGPRSSLAAFMDFALLTVGSLFTVGVAEEQRDIAVTPAVQPARQMAAAPEHALIMAATTDPVHKMAAAPVHAHSGNSGARSQDGGRAAMAEPVHKMAAKTELRHVTAATPEPKSSQVSAVFPESNQVRAALPKSSQITAVVPVSSQVTAVVPKSTAVPESSQDTAVVLVSSQVTAAVPESRKVIAVVPESSKVIAVVPESSKVRAVVPEPSQVTADPHESSQVTTDLHKPDQATAGLHKPSQVSVDLHEPSHVPSDGPEPRHVSSDTPRSRPVMMDPPLVSARAANIPVASAPSNQTIKEVLPPAAALPLMAVAIWCVWAAHCSPEATSVHKHAHEVSSDHKFAPEVPSDLKTAPEVPSDLKTAPEVPSDLKPAPEVSSDRESAPVPPGVMELTADPPKWAADTTIETPEVAAFAAEPLEVAAPTVASPVAAEATEPHKMGTSVLAPCTVVALNHPLLANVPMPGPEPATEAVNELSASLLVLSASSVPALPRSQSMT